MIAPVKVPPSRKAIILDTLELCVVYLWGVSRCHLLRHKRQFQGCIFLQRKVVARDAIFCDTIFFAPPPNTCIPKDSVLSFLLLMPSFSAPSATR